MRPGSAVTGRLAVSVLVMSAVSGAPVAVGEFSKLRTRGEGSPREGGREGEESATRSRGLSVRSGRRDGRSGRCRGAPAAERCRRRWASRREGVGDHRAGGQRVSARCELPSQVRGGVQ